MWLYLCRFAWEFTHCGAVGLGTSSPPLLSSFSSKFVFAKALGDLLSQNTTTHPSSSGSKKIGASPVICRTQARN